MSFAWQLFSGTLLIKEKSCYVIEETDVGSTKSQLILDTLPTGSGWFEGYSAATNYFVTHLHKKSGDFIWFHGLACEPDGQRMIMVLDQRLDFTNPNEVRAS